MEATTFAVRLEDWFVPTMRQKIDLQRNWSGAIRIAGATLEVHEGKLARNLPDKCPFALDEFVSGEFKFDHGLARLCEAMSR